MDREGLVVRVAGVHEVDERGSVDTAIAAGCHEGRAHPQARGTRREFDGRGCVDPSRPLLQDVEPVVVRGGHQDLFRDRRDRVGPSVGFVRLIDERDDARGNRRRHRRATPEVERTGSVAASNERRTGGVERSTAETERARGKDVGLRRPHERGTFAGEVREVSVGTHPKWSRAEAGPIIPSIAKVAPEQPAIIHQRPGADRNHARRGVGRRRGRVAGSVVARREQDRDVRSDTSREVVEIPFQEGESGLLRLREAPAIRNDVRFIAGARDSVVPMGGEIEELCRVERGGKIDSDDFGTGRSPVDVEDAARIAERHARQVGRNPRAVILERLERTVERDDVARSGDE